MRKSLSHVMSATPTKVCKGGRKPKIDIVKNSSCRFYGINFTSGKSIFAVGQRRKCRAFLAECCGSIGIFSRRSLPSSPLCFSPNSLPPPPTPPLYMPATQALIYGLARLSYQNILYTSLSTM